MNGTVADLHDRLRARMDAEGPMRFRDWMDACLYEPDGYYMRLGRKTGAGADADFATAPTLHPFMAQAVAGEVATVWDLHGRPDRFDVVEFGGGEGDLARDAIAHLDAAHPELAAVLRWVHVEKSPVHRALQDGDDRISGAAAMPDVACGVVLAHEFLDALPVHVLERRKGNWAEVYVEPAGDHFAEILGMPSRRAVEAAPKRLIEEGQRVTSMVDAKAWVHEVAQKLGSGALLLIDYGDRGNRLWVPDRPDATVRGFKAHTVVDDLYREPAGAIDITASVDFTQVREWALDAGLHEAYLESQESFLMRHGALEALASAPRDTVEGASAYLRLKQLVMPQAMGSAFKVQRLDTEPVEGDP